MESKEKETELEIINIHEPPAINHEESQEYLRGFEETMRNGAGGETAEGLFVEVDASRRKNQIFDSHTKEQNGLLQQPAFGKIGGDLKMSL